MAYSELIKNFSRIREYMRDFYVFGFKSRNEYTRKSARSYDDERRRLESWLGNHMKFRTTAEGKNVFLSIDSRSIHHNPLFAAWKAKSFTDGDITLHFILFDILYSPSVVLSLSEIMERIDTYLSSFDEPKVFDPSTVRKKLSEYISEGIVVSEKKGKTMYFRRAESSPSLNTDILDFFSEISPCGVIGSYLLDKEGVHDEHFAFKHHYITGALDSEIICSLLEAVNKESYVTIEVINRRKERISESDIVPLKIFVSVQSGRQYLMAYSPRFGRINPFRTDNIISVKIGEKCENFGAYMEDLCGMQKHMWGVSTQGRSGQRMEHVEFTVFYEAWETHIHKRLEREKRCGTVQKLDANHSRFSADVYDAEELMPWIRTFLCRITEIHFSSSELEERFKKDISDMYALYSIDGGESL